MVLSSQVWLCLTLNQAFLTISVKETSPGQWHVPLAGWGAEVKLSTERSPKLVKLQINLTDRIWTRNAWYWGCNSLSKVECFSFSVSVNLLRISADPIVFGQIFDHAYQHFRKSYFHTVKRSPFECGWFHSISSLMLMIYIGQWPFTEMIFEALRHISVHPFGTKTF